MALLFVVPFHSALAGANVIMPIDYGQGGWYALTYPEHAMYGGYQLSAVDFNNIKGSEGWEVYAIQEGTIEYINIADGAIFIRHSLPLTLRNGYTYQTWLSLYGHMKEIPPQFHVGYQVSQGEKIGLTSDRHSTMDLVPHLHFVLCAGTGSENDAISPYWVPGNYANASLYADDVSGTRVGTYNGKPVYDALIFRAMPYAPNTIVPHDHKQTGADTVELSFTAYFSDEKPSQMSFMIWQDGGKKVDLGRSKCPAVMESGIPVTWKVTNDDIKFAPNTTYYYQAYVNFSKRTLLGDTRSFVFEQRSTPYESGVVGLPSTNIHSYSDANKPWTPIISATLSPKPGNEKAQNVIVVEADIYQSGKETKTTGPIYPPFSRWGITVSPDITQWEKAPIKACYDANGEYWEYFDGAWHKNGHMIRTLDDQFHIMYYNGPIIWDGECYDLLQGESRYYSSEYGWE